MRRQSSKHTAGAPRNWRSCRRWKPTRNTSGTPRRWTGHSAAIVLATVAFDPATVAFGTGRGDGGVVTSAWRWRHSTGRQSAGDGGNRPNRPGDGNWANRPSWSHQQLESMEQLRQNNWTNINNNWGNRWQQQLERLQSLV